eukprot:TRINITY_DN106288_c0_g1_i1.p1 TRINITY_DN106288_c0_g1~~TRINITY_DN106288_c0_g1_i1.p1  ORF type:complete len:528 (+),score=109.52 TRINITY_DN106288_c0_g1_i1:3-1586(+)
MPPKTMVMLLDDDDDESDAFTVSASWVVDPASGEMKHSATGTKISEEGGIEFEGQAYRLSAKDIQMDTASHLGAGACGVVKRGIIKKLNVQVAIKTIRVDDKAKRDQLLHEIQGLVLSQGCKCLVQWYAGFVSKDNNSVYVALEYMDLGSLEDLIKRQRGDGVPARYLGCIAKQSMEGLEYLHSKSLMHRDIKPGNILHNVRGEVKLTDFGIAKEVDFGVAQTFVGTTIYMSPERIQGDDYTFVADVWSLGMVVYELATGSYPWRNVSSFPIIFQHLCDEEEPRLDPAVFPPVLCEYVAKCLTRDVAKRMDSFSLLKHDLVVSDACSPTEFARWLQQQGFGTSLFPLDESGTEDAKTTMVPPQGLSAKHRSEEPSAGAQAAGRSKPRSAFGEAAAHERPEHLPIQLQRLPVSRLQEVLAALRTLQQCGLSSIEDLETLEALVSQKVAENSPQAAAQLENELERLSLEELRSRAEEAGAPRAVLGDAERQHLIDYVSSKTQTSGLVAGRARNQKKQGSPGRDFAETLK